MLPSGLHHGGRSPWPPSLLSQAVYVITPDDPRCHLLNLANRYSSWGATSIGIGLRGSR
jgi:hypothetical protein